LEDWEKTQRAASPLPARKSLISVSLSAVAGKARMGRPKSTQNGSMSRPGTVWVQFARNISKTGLEFLDKKPTDEPMMVGDEISEYE
jgi:hypothetical protein